MMTADRAWWSPFRVVDGIDVMHVDLRPDPDREKEAVAWLDRDEHERLSRFRIHRPRLEFSLCRAALRASLCQRLGCPNGDLSFGYHDHGKPFAVVEGQAVRVGFNVSHSAPHGLVALAPRGRLGVDAEACRTGRDFDGIAEMVFGPGERAAVAAARGDDKVRLFYRLWTLKEAVIKALGTGFSLDPSGFEVPSAMLHGADSGQLRCPRNSAETWRLACLDDTGFAAAIAYEDGGSRS